MGTPVGILIRDARRRQRRSQLDLAIAAGLSQRHLSFVELGRSRPSPEVVNLLGRHLGAGLAEQNRWLLAAGHAPRWPATPLADASLGHLRATLQTVIDAHDPYPAVVIDRCWTVQLTNRAAVALAEGIDPEVRGTPTNLFRVCLHPDGFAATTRNFGPWSAYLLRQLDGALERTGDDTLERLATEVATWPGIPDRAGWSDLDPGDQWPVVTWDLDRDGRPLSFVTTMSTLATPNDVVLAELAIEVFLPADRDTAAHLAALAAGSAGPAT